MQSVINSTFYFFFISIGIWVGVAIKKFTKFEWPLPQNTIKCMIGTVRSRWTAS